MPSSDVEGALREVLGPALGEVTIENLVRLSAGANRETWSFDAVAGHDRHGLILQRQRGPEDRHEGIAHVLVQRAVVLEDRSGELLEDLVEHADHRARLHGLGHGREAA